MKAIYCDKCRKLHKEDEINHVKIIGLFKNEDIVLDLCQDCCEKLEVLLGEK